MPPTSAVGPDPETAAGHAAAIGVGSTIPVPANSIASGPLPVASNSGLASWYDAAPRTTASRDYPQGTRLQVCRGDACVVVTVADYGPSAATGRALDLSADSFAAVAPLSRGVVQVSWSVVG